MMLNSASVNSQFLKTSEFLLAKEKRYGADILGNRIHKRLICMCVCVHLLSHIQLFVIPWTVARQASLSMEFSRQEYWSGLPFCTPRGLPNPGIEPTFLASPTLTGGFFTTIPPKAGLLIKHKIHLKSLMSTTYHQTLRQFQCQR